MRIKMKHTFKRYRVDAIKLKRAQRALQTTSEIETIERALEMVISEDKRSRVAAKAHNLFLKSRISIRDVYGNLEP